MHQSSLDTLATRLTAHLDCTQDMACRQIMRAIAETGEPVAPAHLARRLQMSQESLMAHLAGIPDTEFDTQDNIVGWGITLVPTQHQFRLKERPLFTWCAFDTILFPALLQVEAQVQSVCEASGQPITFLATSEGIADLFPATSVLSLILPHARCDCVRGTFCQQSLFFKSEAAASPWLVLHPEAALLSLAEAAAVGQTVAKLWSHSSSV
ncbi:MAG TPA: organomercurial lyase [Ktedonosporobacter sp.]|nr:organomercurial lyase [Ktedonosporobacter sp.]